MLSTWVNQTCPGFFGGKSQPKVKKLSKSDIAERIEKSRRLHFQFTNNCSQCGKKFMCSIQRHNCKRCGKSFCDSCTPMRIPVPQYNYERASRVCDECFLIRFKEMYHDVFRPEEINQLAAERMPQLEKAMRAVEVRQEQLQEKPRVFKPVAELATDCEVELLQLFSAPVLSSSSTGLPAIPEKPNMTEKERLAANAAAQSDTVSMTIPSIIEKGASSRSVQQQPPQAAASSSASPSPALGPVGYSPASSAPVPAGLPPAIDLTANKENRKIRRSERAKEKNQRQAAPAESKQVSTKEFNRTTSFGSDASFGGGPKKIRWPRSNPQTALVDITLPAHMTHPVLMSFVDALDANSTKQLQDIVRTRMFVLNERNRSFQSENMMDIESTDEHGRTAIIIASSYGNLPAVRLLLDQGAKVQAKDINGGSALTFAAVNGNVELARLLIARGAEVNTKDTFGETPLIYAAAHGHQAMVAELIENGSRVNHLDKAGMSALDRAQEIHGTGKSRSGIIALLKMSGKPAPVPPKAGFLAGTSFTTSQLNMRYTVEKS